MNLPEKLTQLRREKSLTQASLAETLNVSRQAISRWEVGTAVPSTDNLKVLSNLYGVPVDYLLNDNTDDLRMDAANQTPFQDDTDKKAVKKSHGMWFYLLITAIAIFIVVAVILIGSWHENESTAIVPVENMDTIVDDNFQTEVFSFE